MIYVGIDIAKETHVAAAVDSDGVIIIEPFSFTNNHEGFKFLKSKLDCLSYIRKPLFKPPYFIFFLRQSSTAFRSA